MSKKILLYCQHSVGIGHLKRTMVLATELKKSFKVCIVSGGAFPKEMKITNNIEFIQLPPIGINDKNLLEAIDCNDPVHLVMRKRQKIILSTYKTFQPDVLITEAFPFGKIQFLGDLLPVLKLIKKSTKKILLLCSHRDIIEPSTSKKTLMQQFSAKMINEIYDGILVHGDEKLIPFEVTCPQIKKLSKPIFHTGYVTDLLYQPKIQRSKLKKVLLSAGAGKIAHPFIHKILNAYLKYGFGEGISLNIIAGPLYPTNQFNTLKRLVSNHPEITLYHSVESLIEFYKSARLSISLGGYNTTMEIIASGVPALISPYYNQTNQEQKIRTSILNNKKLIKIMDYKQMDEKQIAQFVVEALQHKTSNPKVDLDGAAKTRKIILELLG